MNENDLRHCAALMKVITGASAEECFRFADEFIEASKAKPEDEAGIAALKPRRRRKADD